MEYPKKNRHTQDDPRFFPAICHWRLKFTIKSKVQREQIAAGLLHRFVSSQPTLSVAVPTSSCLFYIGNVAQNKTSWIWQRPPSFHHFTTHDRDDDDDDWWQNDGNIYIYVRPVNLFLFSCIDGVQHSAVLSGKRSANEPLCSGYIDATIFQLIARCSVRVEPFLLRAAAAARSQL